VGESRCPWKKAKRAAKGGKEESRSTIPGGASFYQRAVLCGRKNTKGFFPEKKDEAVAGAEEGPILSQKRGGG